MNDDVDRYSPIEKMFCLPSGISIDPNMKLSGASKEALVDKEIYQRHVGELLYLSHKDQILLLQ